MDTQTPGQENINQQYSKPFMQPSLPNSTAVLVLGILSIVGCFCYGFTGLILGIIALVLSGKGNDLYLQNPNMYSEQSYKNMKAGRVCAIIGTSLSAVGLVIIIIQLVFWGTMLSTIPWETISNH